MVFIFVLDIIYGERNLLMREVLFLRVGLWEKSLEIKKFDAVLLEMLLEELQQKYGKLIRLKANGRVKYIL